jgi:hypothetical protein
LCADKWDAEGHSPTPFVINVGYQLTTADTHHMIFERVWVITEKYAAATV